MKYIKAVVDFQMAKNWKFYKQANKYKLNISYKKYKSMLIITSIHWQYVKACSWVM